MLQTIEQTHSKPVHYAAPITPPVFNTGSPSLSTTPVTATNNFEMSIPNHHHILIVTGPAGCGKSTVAQQLASRYGFDYIEGDEVSHYIAPILDVVIDSCVVPSQGEHRQDGGRNATQR